MGLRIVQLANFYGPRSGGLRTAVHHLGAGYVARGHEVVLVVPGRCRTDEVLDEGVHRITLPAPVIPGSGGYQLLDPYRTERLLDRLGPDRIEVSDRLTLRRLGSWAARRGVPGVVVSHERLDRLLGQAGLPQPLARRLADWSNAKLAAHFDTVVCTTEFARAEFDRIGAANVRQVPLGVDLACFTPACGDVGMRTELAAGADVLLVHCGRLSPEKHVERSVDAAAALHRAGMRVRLVVAGDGPRRRALQRRAAALPVTFLGFVVRRVEVASLLATADLMLAPGPHETFGLAALEALACGTPVVASRSSALAEIVRPDFGRAVADHAQAFASGIRELLAVPRPVLRAAARRRAEQFTWSAAVDGMLTALRAS